MYVVSMYIVCIDGVDQINPNNDLSFYFVLVFES